MEKQLIMTIKFKCIDDWNRPVYSVLDYTKDGEQIKPNYPLYVGDTEKLFNWSASKEEVDAYFKEHSDQLVIFGTNINDDPYGTTINKNFKIVIV